MEFAERSVCLLSCDYFFVLTFIDFITFMLIFQDVFFFFSFCYHFIDDRKTAPFSVLVLDIIKICSTVHVSSELPCQSHQHVLFMCGYRRQEGD